MPDIAIVTETELRRLIVLDRDTVNCIRACFRSLATEAIVMPPILRLDIAEHNGEVDVKTAYIPGVDAFALKVSPGFFDNPRLGLPSVSGLMVVMSARTGQVQALLLDNGYLTDLRTAAAGAVAADVLARPDAHRVGILGAGTQARLQLKALTLVREVSEVRVWARHKDRAAAYAAEMATSLKLPVRVEPEVASVVADADIVVTTTPSRNPLIQPQWLHPGLHITAMGSDAEHKNELAPGVISRADHYVCDRRSQCVTLGELHHALEAGSVAAEQHFPELGEIIAGRAVGRGHEEDITICDLTGTGAQDTAIATLALQRVQTAEAGTRVAT